jgi:hypothetical protein
MLNTSPSRPNKVFSQNAYLNNSPLAGATHRNSKGNFKKL